MEHWKLYAFAAALFAGVNAVVAKAGPEIFAADLCLAVWTEYHCLQDYGRSEGGTVPQRFDVGTSAAFSADSDLSWAFSL